MSVSIRNLQISFGVLLAGTLCAFTAGCGNNPSDPVASPGPTSARQDPTEVSEASFRSQQSLPASENIQLPSDAPLGGIDPKKLPKEVNFFAPPKTTAAQREIIVQDTGKDKEIRLLGFIHTKNSDSLAILKIGDQLVRLREGEDRGGITLLTISGRSVTLQQNRKRWTVVLMEQPLVNPAVRRTDQHDPFLFPTETSHGGRVSKRNAAAGSRPTQSMPLGPEDSAPPAATLPPGSPGEAALPGDLPSPEEPLLPNLPELEGLPELPGL